MKEIHIATIVSETISKKFDEVCEIVHRSRADHLRYMIEKEIEYHNSKEDKES